MQKRKLKTYNFLVPHRLNRQIRTYIKENNIESLAEFIRTAIDDQLRLEGPIEYPLPTHRQRRILFCLFPDMLKNIESCTARTNYSSVSDFIRSAIRNKLSKGEIKT